MALPSSGTIWISQIRDEFGNWGPPNYLSHYYRGNLTTENNTGVPTSGYISLAHFYGTSKAAQPGSADYTSPGTYTFVVPNYNTIRVRVWGAGGSGAARSSFFIAVGGSNGNSGGSSSAFGVVSGGGGGGLIGDAVSVGTGGTGGTGQTQNGGNGGNGVSAPFSIGTGGSGGSSPFGGAGSPGTSGRGVHSSPGGFPGGGSGGTCGFGSSGGGGGGAGGYSDVTFTIGQSGAPVPGTSHTIVVGAGGAGVSDGDSAWSGKGGDGRVIIDWS